MEKKTKQRILGLLTIVGITVIMLPFFQSNQEVSPEATLTEAAATKTPPFPDQPMQVSTDATMVAAPPVMDEQSVENSKTISQAETTNMQEAVATTSSSSAYESFPTPPDEQAPVNNEIANNNSMTPPAVDTVAAANQANANQDQAPPQAPTPVAKPMADDFASLETINNSSPPASVKNTNSQKIKSAKIAKTKQVKTIKIKEAKLKTIPKKPLASVTSLSSLDNNGLLKFKSSVWVIQMGSFTKKERALRLVNQLRANGYRAFIQKAGDDIRVFVGPENQHASARELASRLESEVHIRGMVISYQPLRL